MNYRIAQVSVDEKSLSRGGTTQHDRQRVIADLLDHSYFRFGEEHGPFHVHIEIRQNKLSLKVYKDEVFLSQISCSMMPLRSIIKDYRIICESYFDAVNVSDPRKVEGIDMGRRGVHNEGAEVLKDLLQESVEIDFETARTLFALVCLLSTK